MASNSSKPVRLSEKQAIDFAGEKQLAIMEEASGVIKMALDQAFTKVAILEEGKEQFGNAKKRKGSIVNGVSGTLKPSDVPGLILGTVFLEMMKAFVEAGIPSHLLTRAYGMMDAYLDLETLAKVMEKEARDEKLAENVDNIRAAKVDTDDFMSQFTGK